VIFNETELAENMSVGGLSQNIIAPTNIITINMLTENKEDEFIPERIRKSIFKIELPKETVGVIKILSDILYKVKLAFYNLYIHERDSD
jgi:hypothetical protein